MQQYQFLPPVINPIIAGESLDKKLNAKTPNTIKTNTTMKYPKTAIKSLLTNRITNLVIKAEKIP